MNSNLNIKKEEESFSWLDVPKSLWYFLAEDKWRFLFFFILLTSILFYTFVPAFIVGKVVDFFTVYKQGDSLGVFYKLIIFLGVSYIIVSIIRLQSKQAIDIFGHKARTRVRILGFERLTSFSLEWHNKENTGNKLQRIFTGSDAIKGGMRLLTKEGLKICVDIVGAVIIFVVANTQLAILISTYVLIFLWIEMSLSKKIYSLSNKFNQLNQSSGGVYVEGANNILAIKALGTQDTMNKRVSDKEDQSRIIGIQKTKATITKWTVFQFVNGIVLTIFLLILGKGVVSGAFTLGVIVIFFAYFLKLRDAFGDFSAMHSDLIDLRSDLANLMPIFKETEVIKTGNKDFPISWEEIKIKDVEMTYGSGQTGLKNLNLILKRNSKIGIAGLSGSGKSTLAKIILGLYGIKKGEFKIGDTDYYSIDHKESLKNITVVLQETELFNLSLRENITMMRDEDYELLKQAIEISQLDEVIKRLPEKLDSRIGEKGYMLSGGERQRLGIARAVYKNAPIIILDEATSSLDSETEAKVMSKLFGSYGKDKTFLIIAHRLGTLKYTDKIIVMENGENKEEGTYDELMNNQRSVFYRLNSLHESQNLVEKNKLKKEQKSSKIA